ncbi:MAG: L-threonylcarbamoyladenylate synthase [Xanthomonadales bacterium]|nr:L-threonylcarbamoyladenylate synthase [Xanthomonadales bacterium]
MQTIDVDAAAEIVAAGGLIAYPTESIYGLGCDPRNPYALTRLIELKGRDAAKGLILIAANETQLQGWLDPSRPEELQAARATWPGPVTWVMNAAPDVEPPLAKADGTIAVRIPDHEVCRRLCIACRSVLISTSANRSGQPPARTTEDVIEIFGSGVDGIVEGECGGRERPSEIRDARTGEVLRPG